MSLEVRFQDFHNRPNRFVRIFFGQTSEGWKWSAPDENTRGQDAPAFRSRTAAHRAARNWWRETRNTLRNSQ